LSTGVAPLIEQQLAFLFLGGLLGLALFAARVFFAPLNLLRFLAVSFCDGRFSCSSDGALLCLATRIKSPIACRI
jgi:hypothetical protein